MATDLRTSFERFSTRPSNIAVYGWTKEEAALREGRPDPNPVLSPMPLSAVTAIRLGLDTSGSDKLRVAEPIAPEANPYEGPQSWLSLSRSAVQKMGGAIVGSIQSTIADMVQDPDLQTLMRDSLTRLGGMRDSTSMTVKWADSIQAKQAAASKA
jgi:hypothetical protein